MIRRAPTAGKERIIPSFVLKKCTSNFGRLDRYFGKISMYRQIVKNVVLIKHKHVETQTTVNRKPRLYEFNVRKIKLVHPVMKKKELLALRSPMLVFFPSAEH